MESKPGALSHQRTEEVMRHMQETADAEPPSIEASIRRAEELEVYTHEEAELYIDAFRKAFHKCHELYDE